jgi:transcriptional regulator with XRE-family HTH domain
MAKKTLNHRHVLIKQSLGLRDLTFSHVARRLRVTRNAVSRVSRGECASERIRRALSRATGLPYKELWER